MRDRYGQLPPQYVPPAAAEVFRLTAKRTLIDTTIIKRENGRPMCSSSRIASGPVLPYIQSRPGHRYSPTLLRCRTMPFPVIFMGITQRNGNAALRETVWERVGKTLESSAQVWPPGKFAAPRAYLRRRHQSQLHKFSDWQFHHTPHTTTNP